MDAKRPIAVALLLACAYGCGSQPIPPHNQETQVWLIPPPAGDLMNLAKHPDQWVEAAKRTDVVSLYQLSAYTQANWDCGNACGPNTYQALIDVVPGGMFKWLSDHFILAQEAGSVKPQACTTKQLDLSIFIENRTLDNIAASGGHVSYISLDEPFASGVTICHLAPDKVAQLQKYYNDGVHAQHPEVQIGLIEPYPAFTADEIVSFIKEFQNAGVPVPYFHLDFDQERAVREGQDWKDDIQKIRKFCLSQKIPFGVLLVGFDGRTDELFAAGYWAVTRAAFEAVGVTEHTVLQSWAEDPPGDMMSLKHTPHVVPQTDPNSQTGLLLETLDFFGIHPAS